MTCYMAHSKSVAWFPDTSRVCFHTDCPVSCWASSPSAPFSFLREMRQSALVSQLPMWHPKSLVTWENNLAHRSLCSEDPGRLPLGTFVQGQAVAWPAGMMASVPRPRTEGTIFTAPMAEPGAEPQRGAVFQATCLDPERTAFSCRSLADSGLGPAFWS